MNGLIFGLFSMSLIWDVIRNPLTNSYFYIFFRGVGINHQPAIYGTFNYIWLMVYMVPTI